MAAEWEDYEYEYEEPEDEYDGTYAYDEPEYEYDYGDEYEYEYDPTEFWAEAGDYEYGDGGGYEYEPQEYAEAVEATYAPLPDFSPYDPGAPLEGEPASPDLIASGGDWWTSLWEQAGATAETAKPAPAQPPPVSDDWWTNLWNDAQAPPQAAAKPAAQPAAPKATSVQPFTVDHSSRTAFMASFAPAAAQALEAKGLPASLAPILVAIPVNEQGWQKVPPGNNYYGIKGSNPRTGANTGPVGTWEEVNGRRVNTTDTFRVYDSPAESVMDHLQFLEDNPRYADALRIGRETGDPEQFIRAVHRAGYATDALWADKILNIARDVPAVSPAAAAVPDATSRQTSNQRIPPGHHDGDGHDHGVATPYTQHQADKAGNVYTIAFDFNEKYSNPFNPAIPRHRGVDLQVTGMPNGGMDMPYTAFRSGKVAKITNDPNGGIGIIVDTGDPNARYDRYFHNNSVAVKEGDTVTAGETNMGLIGETGTKGFPHLHYEVSNGINGDPMGQTIDPRPYMSRPKPAPVAPAAPAAAAPAAPAPVDRQQIRQQIAGTTYRPDTVPEWMIDRVVAQRRPAAPAAPAPAPAPDAARPTGAGAAAVAALPPDRPGVRYTLGDKTVTRAQYETEVAKNAESRAKFLAAMPEPTRNAFTEWETYRKSRNESPGDIPAFREHLGRIGAPDPWADEERTVAEGRAKFLAQMPEPTQRAFTEWEAYRKSRNEPIDTQAFREHLDRIGAPNPWREQEEAAAASKVKYDAWIRTLPANVQTVLPAWQAERRAKGEDPNDDAALDAHLRHLGIANPFRPSAQPAAPAAAQPGQAAPAQAVPQWTVENLDGTTRVIGAAEKAQIEAQNAALERINANNRERNTAAQREREAVRTWQEAYASWESDPTGQIPAPGPRPATPNLDWIQSQGAADESGPREQPIRISTTYVDPTGATETAAARTRAEARVQMGELTRQPRLSDDPLVQTAVAADQRGATLRQQTQVQTILDHPEDPRYPELARQRELQRADELQLASSPSPTTAKDQLLAAVTKQYMEDQVDPRLLDRLEEIERNEAAAEGREVRPVTIVAEGKPTLDPGLYNTLLARGVPKEEALRRATKPAHEARVITLERPTAPPLSTEPEVDKATYDFWIATGFPEEEARRKATFAPQAVMPDRPTWLAPTTTTVDPNLTTGTAIGNALQRDASTLRTNLLTVGEEIAGSLGLTNAETQLRQNRLILEDQRRQSGIDTRTTEGPFDSPFALVETLAEQTSQIIPTLLATAVTGGGFLAGRLGMVGVANIMRAAAPISRTGMVIGSLSAAGAARREMEDEIGRGEISRPMANLIAIGAGTAEYLAERYMPGLDKALVAGLGDDVARRWTADIKRRGIAALPINVGKEVIQEALEEAATESFAVAVDDVFSGHKPTLTEAVTRIGTSAALGGLTGGLVSMPMAVVTTAVERSQALARAISDPVWTPGADALSWNVEERSTPARELARDGYQLVPTAPDFSRWNVTQATPNGMQTREFGLAIQKNEDGTVDRVISTVPYRGNITLPEIADDDTAGYTNAVNSFRAVMGFMNENAGLTDARQNGSIGLLQGIAVAAHEAAARARAEDTAAAARGETVQREAVTPRPHSTMPIASDNTTTSGGANYQPPRAWFNAGVIRGTDVALYAADTLDPNAVMEMMHGDETVTVLTAAIAETLDRLDRRAQPVGLLAPGERRDLVVHLFADTMNAMNLGDTFEAIRASETGRLSKLGAVAFDPPQLVIEAIWRAQNENIPLASPAFADVFTATLLEAVSHEPGHDPAKGHDDAHVAVMNAFGAAVVAEHEALLPLMEELHARGKLIKLALQYTKALSTGGTTQRTRNNAVATNQAVRLELGLAPDAVIDRAAAEVIARAAAEPRAVSSVASGTTGSEAAEVAVSPVDGAAAPGRGRRRSGNSRVLPGSGRVPGAGATRNRAVSARLKAGRPIAGVPDLGPPFSSESPTTVIPRVEAAAEATTPGRTPSPQQRWKQAQNRATRQEVARRLAEQAQIPIEPGAEAAPSITGMFARPDQIAPMGEDGRPLTGPSAMVGRKAAAALPIPIRGAYPDDVMAAINRANRHPEIRDKREVPRFIPGVGMVFPDSWRTANKVDADRRAPRQIVYYGLWPGYDPDYKRGKFAGRKVGITDTTPGAGFYIQGEHVLRNPLVYHGEGHLIDHARQLMDIVGLPRSEADILVGTIHNQADHLAPTVENITSLMTTIGYGDPTQAPLLITASDGDWGYRDGGLADLIVTSMMGYEGRARKIDGVITYVMPGDLMVGNIPRTKPSITEAASFIETTNTNYVTKIAQIDPSMFTNIPPALLHSLIAARTIRPGRPSAREQEIIDAATNRIYAHPLGRHMIGYEVQGNRLVYRSDGLVNDTGYEIRQGRLVYTGYLRPGYDNSSGRPIYVGTRPSTEGGAIAPGVRPPVERRLPPPPPPPPAAPRARPAALAYEDFAKQYRQLAAARQAGEALPADDPRRGAIHVVIERMRTLADANPILMTRYREEQRRAARQWSGPSAMASSGPPTEQPTVAEQIETATTRAKPVKDGIKELGLSAKQLDAQITAQVIAHIENGGSTFHHADGNLKGQPLYSVSLYPELGEVYDAPPTVEQIEKFTRKNRSLLTDGRLSVGTWFNEENNKHYVDISVTIPDQQLAEYLGQDYNQWAIYDLTDLNAIQTGGDGTVPRVLPPIATRLPLRGEAAEAMRARLGEQAQAVASGEELDWWEREFGADPVIGGSPKAIAEAAMTAQPLEQALRASAAASPDGLAHLTGDELRPFMPFRSPTLRDLGSAIGTPMGMDDQRKLVAYGIEQGWGEWYRIFGRHLTALIPGIDRDEATGLFSHYSSQLSPEQALNATAGTAMAARDTNNFAGMTDDQAHAAYKAAMKKAGITGVSVSADNIKGARTMYEQGFKVQSENAWKTATFQGALTQGQYPRRLDVGFTGDVQAQRVGGYMAWHPPDEEVRAAKAAKAAGVPGATEALDWQNKTMADPGPWQYLGGTGRWIAQELDVPPSDAQAAIWVIGQRGVIPLNANTLSDFRALNPNAPIFKQENEYRLRGEAEAKANGVKSKAKLKKAGDEAAKTAPMLAHWTQGAEDIKDGKKNVADVFDQLRADGVFDLEDPASLPQILQTPSSVNFRNAWMAGGYDQMPYPGAAPMTEGLRYEATPSRPWMRAGAVQGAYSPLYARALEEAPSIGGVTFGTDEDGWIAELGRPHVVADVNDQPNSALLLPGMSPGTVEAVAQRLADSTGEPLTLRRSTRPG